MFSAWKNAMDYKTCFGILFHQLPKFQVFHKLEAGGKSASVLLFRASKESSLSHMTFSEVVRSYITQFSSLHLTWFFTLQGTLGCRRGPEDSLRQNELKRNSQKPFSVFPGNRLRAASELSTKSLAERLGERWIWEHKYIEKIQKYWKLLKIINSQKSQGLRSRRFQHPPTIASHPNA